MKTKQVATIAAVFAVGAAAGYFARQYAIQQAPVRSGRRPVNEKIRMVRQVCRDVDPVLARLEAGYADGGLSPGDAIAAAAAYFRG